MSPCRRMPYGFRNLAWISYAIHCYNHILALMMTFANLNPKRIIWKFWTYSNNLCNANIKTSHPVWQKGWKQLALSTTKLMSLSTIVCGSSWIELYHITLRKFSTNPHSDEYKGYEVHTRQLPVTLTYWYGVTIRVVQNVRMYFHPVDCGRLHNGGPKHQMAHVTVRWPPRGCLVDFELGWVVAQGRLKHERGRCE